MGEIEILFEFNENLGTEVGQSLKLIYFINWLVGVKRIRFVI